jgi:hypothetical protein
MIRSKNKTGVTNHGNYLASTTKYFVLSWKKLGRRAVLYRLLVEFAEKE